MGLAGGDVVAGRYQLVRQLGEGGFGTVFEAERTDGGGRVALKVMHARHGERSEEHQRFEREASILAALEHPNVVRTLDYGYTEDDLPYIAFELYEGRTLQGELRAGGPMHWPRVAAIVRQVLVALDAAHGRGIIHRDIKPANIFLRGGDDTVKVLDFGLAKPLHGGANTAALTATGQMLGTPHYMAPEQVRGGTIVPSVDLYSLGVVLCELLSGRKLVDAESDIEVFMEHVSDAPFELPIEVTVTPLARLTATAVAKTPAARYASAQEMLADLDAVMRAAAQPGQASAWVGGTLAIPETTACAAGASTQATPLAPPPRRSAAPPFIAIAGAVVLVLALGGAAAFLVLGGPAKLAALRNGSSATSSANTAHPTAQSSPTAPAPNGPIAIADFDATSLRKRLEALGLELTKVDDNTYPVVAVTLIELGGPEAGGGVQLYRYEDQALADSSFENYRGSKPLAKRIEGKRLLVVIRTSGDPEALMKRLLGH